MVERHLAKVNVASSNLVFRSIKDAYLCVFYHIILYRFSGRYLRVVPSLPLFSIQGRDGFRGYLDAAFGCGTAP